MYAVTVSLVFLCTPNNGSRCVYDSCVLWGILPSAGLPSLVSMGRLLPCLTVFCLLLFDYCLLEACTFLKRDGRAIDLEERVRVGNLEE